MSKDPMTRAMFYCPWCKEHPTHPCDAHRAGYFEMMEAMAYADGLRHRRRRGFLARLLGLR